MNGTTTAEGFINWAIQVLFMLALASIGIALYHGRLRGNRLVTSTGRYVYVQGRSRIGIPVIFMNDGPGAAVINSGSLTLYDDSNAFQFDLELVAPPSEDRNDQDGKIEPLSAPNSLKSPVTIKAGDTAQGVFWYSARPADFKFHGDIDYSASLSFLGKSSEPGKTNSSTPTTALELCSAIVLFHIDDITAKNAAQNQNTTIFVLTGWPTRP